MIVGSLVAIVFAGLLLALVVRAASRNPGSARLGSRELAFRADRLAEEIAERGPVLFKDPLRRGNAANDLYVQHVGADPTAGWVALRAYAAEPVDRCLLQWDGAAGRFRDPCSDRTYPADGQGLRTYRVSVSGGVVRVSVGTEEGAAPGN